MSEERGAPSIEEMRHELTRNPDRLEWYPPVSQERSCARCGTVKAAWWLIENGIIRCAACVGKRDE